MFHSIISAIRGYDSRFTDLELLIFGRLKLIMPEDRVVNLNRRMGSINRIYRIDGGREVLFYNKKYGSILLDDEFTISNINGLCVYSSFSIKSKDPMTRNSGKILLFDGVLFSMVYNNITEHCAVSNIDSIIIKIIDRPSKEN